MKVILSILFSACYIALSAQEFKLSGRVLNGKNTPLSTTVYLLPNLLETQSDSLGRYSFSGLKNGAYEVQVHYGNQRIKKSLLLKDSDLVLDIDLQSADVIELQTVDIHYVNDKVADKLKQVEGTAIYAGKKTELIQMRNLNVNLATNNARQVYARIAGLNIWEYDGGGLQLGIGGRGLNPSRVSNFNTRQNGYDMSADALGYPESYYTPVNEALERIEIVRGAASLQYGTQFGGMINFVMKKGPTDKPFELTTRQTMGSFGFFNSFNSIGGQAKKLNYYAYYQHKKGDSWRANGHYKQNGAYVHLDYDFTDRLKVTAEYTHSSSLAQQPGGLTDAAFEEDASQSIRPRNWFKVDWNLMALIFDYKFSENTKINWRNSYLLAGRKALGVLNYINRPDPGEGSPRDLMDDKYNNFGSELRFLHQYQLFNQQQSTLLVGARAYRGQTDRKQGNADAGKGPVFDYVGDEPSIASHRFPGMNYSLFVENIFQITEKFSVTPGARFEYINTKSKGYFMKRQVGVPDVRELDDRQNSRSFAFVGVGLSYKPNPLVELYTNVSQNYKGINFNDLRVVNMNARVDPNLRDEKGYTIDGGARGNLKDWLYYDLSVFYLKYNDRIGSVFVVDDLNMLYRLRTNVSDSRNIGFESLIEADVLKAITNAQSKYKLIAYSNFSLIDAKYINTENTAILNKEVEFVPPMLFRSGLSFGDKRFNVALQYSFVKKHFSDATNAESTPTAVDGIIPSYQVVDFNASYNWKWFTLYGSINNLLNEKYFTRRADGYPGPGIIPSDPRGYFLTLQFKW